MPLSPCLGLKPRPRSKQMPRASASQCFRAYSGATFRLSVLAFSISALAPGDVSQLSTTRTTGSRISNLRKDYVESHLSPHFSLTIAYSSPPEPGRCDFAQERPASSGTTKNESIESLRDLSLAGRRALGIGRCLRLMGNSNQGSGNGTCATSYGVISQIGGSKWIMQR